MGHFSVSQPVSLPCPCGDGDLNAWRALSRALHAGSEPCLHLKHQRPYSREGMAGLARAHRRASGKGM